MPQHPTNHARHASNSLQENKSNHPFPLRHLERLRVLGVLLRLRDLRLVFVACGEVGAPAEEPDDAQRDLVGHVFCFAVGYYYVFHLLFGVAVGKLELARVRERKGEGGLGRGTYTGWCHAGGVYLMWGASAGGKYSFN
jgi:hypothetical protein